MSCDVAKLGFYALEVDKEAFCAELIEILKVLSNFALFTPFCFLPPGSLRRQQTLNLLSDLHQGNTLPSAWSCLPLRTPPFAASLSLLHPTSPPISVLLLAFPSFLFPTFLFSSPIFLFTPPPPFLESIWTITPPREAIFYSKHPSQRKVSPLQVPSTCSGPITIANSLVSLHTQSL